MHELSIAGTIIETVEQEMVKRGITRLAAIGLKIGRMTDVDAESLKFGFEVIAKETLLAGTALVIEHVPVIARCTACGADFKVPDLFFVCPSCHATSVDIIHGQELDIAYLEIPDEVPEDSHDTVTANQIGKRL